MTGEKISVIIPVYNVENYLDRCVKSVIGQTYKNLEIILVDDGSTDLSGKMCDDYAVQDDRIQVIHKTNGGLSDARNTGIGVATGNVLTFIDSDDYISKDMVEAMYRAKTDAKAQIACCLFRMVKDNELLEDAKANVVSDKPELLSCAEALKKMLRQSEIFCSAWAKLYDCSLFSDIRYPKGELHEDLGTTYKLFAKAGTVALVRIEGYYYYVRPGSIQNSPFTQKKMVQLRFAQEQKAFLDERFPELRLATTDRLVSECFHMLFCMVGQPKFDAERRELQRIIKANRQQLLFDKGTSRKTRFGCMLSYLGFHTTWIVYKILGFRGKMMG